MGKFSDILLTVDFDRTLTAPDSTIPPRNLEAIRWFMEEGGAFTVNTGRSVPMYAPLLEVVPVNAPLLLYNGSAAYDPAYRRLTFAVPIEMDWRQTIARTRALLPDLTVELQGLRRHYLFEKNPMWERFCAHNHCAWAYDPEAEPGPFLKFSVYGRFRGETVAQLYTGSPEELARMDEAQALLAREFGDRVSIFRAGDRIIDIHAAGVDKGKSARALQRQLDRKILVCVGDARNDLAMLEQADFAYIPGDATISGFERVCDCAQGAVADVIEKKLERILRERVDKTHASVVESSG